MCILNCETRIEYMPVETWIGQPTCDLKYRLQRFLYEPGHAMVNQPSHTGNMPFSSPQPVGIIPALNLWPPNVTISVKAPALVLDWPSSITHEPHSPCFPWWLHQILPPPLLQGTPPRHPRNRQQRQKLAQVQPPPYVNRDFGQTSKIPPNKCHLA